MGVVVVLHPILRRLYDRAYLAAGEVEKLSSKQQGDHRRSRRISFDFLFAAIFLSVLHGFSALKVLLILYVNFQLATRLPRSAIPPATWAFNMFILLANELCHGYPYARVAELILPAPFVQGHESWASWMDSYGGLIPRWEILFNITVLRLISFNLDYYWSLNQRGDTALEVGGITKPTAS